MCAQPSPSSEVIVRHEMADFRVVAPLYVLVRRPSPYLSHRLHLYTTVVLHVPMPTGG